MQSPGIKRKNVLDDDYLSTLNKSKNAAVEELKDDLKLKDSRIYKINENETMDDKKMRH